MSRRETLVNNLSHFRNSNPSNQKEIQVKEDENTSIKNRLLALLYQGEKRINIVNSMKRYVNKILPENVKLQTAFTRKRLSITIKTKDGTNFEHQHDIIYQVKCSTENCSDDYIRESVRRIIERVKEHSRRDTKPHVLKHSSKKKTSRSYTRRL